MNGLKFAGKAALGAAGAAAMGMVGLGLGIAGNDLEDVFKFAGTGAALGASTVPALASNAARGVMSAGRNMRNLYEQGAYGYQEAAVRQAQREFINNKENQEIIRENLEKDREKSGDPAPTKDEIKEAINVAAEYSTGIGTTDMNQINKAMKLEKDIQGQLQGSNPEMSAEDAQAKAREQAKSIGKIANGIKAEDLRNDNKVSDLKESFARELQNNGNWSRKEAVNEASRIIDMVKKQKGVY